MDTCQTLTRSLTSRLALKTMFIALGDCQSGAWQSSTQTTKGVQLLELTGWSASNGGWGGMHDPSCPNGWSLLHSNRFNNQGWNQYNQPGTVQAEIPWTVTCFSSSPKQILQLKGWRASNVGWGGNYNPTCPNGWHFLHSNQYNNIGGWNANNQLGTVPAEIPWTLTCEK